MGQCPSSIWDSIPDHETASQTMGQHPGLWYNGILISLELGTAFWSFPMWDRVSQSEVGLSQVGQGFPM